MLKGFWRVVLIVMGLLGGSTLALQAQIDTQRVISVGQNAIYFKDYVLAIQYFNSAIQSAPYLAEPYYYRGLSKYSLDDYLGAEADSSAAIERNPFLVGSYYLRAISRHTLGKDSLALEDYKVVLQDNPDHKGALHNSALLRMALKDSIGTRATLDHLHRYYPDYAEGYMIDGGFQLERGDTVAAINLFEKALAISPTLSGAYLSMAGISYDRGNYSEAEGYINRAMEYMPDRAELYLNRGIVRYQQYNIKGAMADYSIAIELDPTNTLALYNRALLRSQVGEINAAQEDFNKVVQREPNNYFALFNRAIISNQIGDYQVAEADLDRIIERYPTFLPALVERADARTGQGKSQAAREDLYLASKMTYDKGTLQKATSQQAKQAALAEETERVRSEKDDNIQKFRSLVYASQQKAYDELYTEEQGIRGRIQDREVLIEPEPLFTLSYYVAVDKQLKTNTNTAYSSAIGLPTEEYGVLVVEHLPQLSQAELQKHINAVDSFDLSIPHSAEAMMHLALNQLTIKDHDAVVQTMGQIIEAIPEDPAPYFQRATSRILAYEAESAKDGERNSQNRLGISMNSTLSKEYLKKKAISEEALTDLKVVLELIPNYVPALFNIAYIKASMGNYSEAIEYYNQVLKLEPTLGSAYFNRGLCHYAIGEKQLGDNDLSQAGALGYFKAYSIIKRMK